MPNPVTHWQILTKQPAQLEQFYSDLFGWKISGDNPMGYKVVDTDSGGIGIGGGLWPIGANDGHSMVQLFVSVDDVPAYLANAEKLGAKIVIPHQVLPGGDEMAVVVDPEGIPFGLFKSAGKS